MNTEQKSAIEDILKAIDRNLLAHGQEEHDARLKEFMDALDYYLERQAQAWVR